MIELAIIGYIIGLIGVINFMDGLYSLLLYLGKPSWRGAKAQDFRHDHWVRIVRMMLGLLVILLGGILIWLGVRL
ncbi:hypothetical protein LCGC14_0970850 [marine sediment metagenome]|uniref:Uncharacterized protein n=1 Tax=marine sediment metagenome TaxID=412755 RepID=A0A0F9NXV8_9ZZZZ